MVDLVITRIDHDTGGYSVARNEMESREKAETVIFWAGHAFSADSSLKILDIRPGFLLYKSANGATITWCIDTRGAE